jgi:hypothetical protein
VAAAHNKKRRRVRSCMSATPCKPILGRDSIRYDWDTRNGATLAEIVLAPIYGFGFNRCRGPY